MAVAEIHEPRRLFFRELDLTVLTAVVELLITVWYVTHGVSHETNLPLTGSFCR